MKKYIKPSIKTTKVELTQMIALSMGIDNNTNFDPEDALGKDRGWEEDEPEF